MLFHVVDFLLSFAYAVNDFRLVLAPLSLVDRCSRFRAYFLGRRLLFNGFELLFVLRCLLFIYCFFANVSFDGGE